MMIPHHVGYGPAARGLDWEHFDERHSPVVEMVSSHGSSEADGAPRPSTTPWARACTPAPSRPAWKPGIDSV